MGLNYKNSPLIDFISNINTRFIFRTDPGDSSVVLCMCMSGLNVSALVRCNSSNHPLVMRDLYTWNVNQSTDAVGGCLTMTCKLPTKISFRLSHV